MQKRILSLILALTIVIAASLTLGLSVSGDFVYGDCNRDSDVDMKDILLLRKYVSNPTGTLDIELTAADVNLDESIDMKDVLMIRKFIAHIIDALGVKENPTTTTVTARTSKSRVPTEPSHHDTVDLSEQPQLDVTANGTKTLGTWWWKIGDGVTVNVREAYLDFLDYNGVTEIYYYCYDRMRVPNTRQETHEFVVSAMNRGIRVAVLYDDPNSQKADNTYFTDTVVANYLAYKQEYPSDWLYGIHCDVEHKVNKANAQTYVDNFLLAEVQPARDQGIIVELDLSANYNDDPNKSEITCDGQKMHFYEACARHCDTMCIMSYRTTVDKLKYCVSLSGPYAQKVGTKIVYSIEVTAYKKSDGSLDTGDSNNDPAINFCRESKKYVYTTLQDFADFLKPSDYPAGIGFAIHSTNGWAELKPAFVAK